MSNKADSDTYSSTESSSDWEAPPRPTEGEEPKESGGEGNGFEGKRFEEMEKTEKELAGAGVLIKFVLPNNTELVETFPHGQTVQFLKIWLEDEHKVDYGSHQLFLKNKILIDPLSLNDIKDFQTGEVENVVEVRES